ncbi:MAG: hypothetical protein J0M17_08795 [Planctomycetes bacterium]|nr:hypothetical protein [Planctomycetota bacterium]
MKKFLMLALVAVSLGLLGAGSAEAASGCHCQAPAVAVVQPTAPAATTAQAPQVRRSFTYEPGTVPAATYAPARRYRSSQTPVWALPKSDPRKYTNGI